MPTSVPRQGALLSAVHSYLMYKPDPAGEMQHLCDINEFPSPDGGTPDAVYSKNLSSRTPKSTQGWYAEDSSSMDFPADYDLETFKALKALEGTLLTFGVWIGGTESTDASTGENIITPTGEDGKWEGPGTLTVSKDGGQVDGFQTMTIRIDKADAWLLVDESNNG